MATVWQLCCQKINVVRKMAGMHRTLSLCGRWRLSTCFSVFLASTQLCRPSVQHIDACFISAAARATPRGGCTNWPRAARLRQGPRAHVFDVCSPPATRTAQRRAYTLDLYAAVPSLGAGSAPDSLFPSMSELNPFPPASQQAIVVDDLLQLLQVDDRHRQLIEQTPQGSQDWLDARKYRLTASNFGAAAGRNRFRSPVML